MRLIVLVSALALSACTSSPRQSIAVPEVRIGLLGSLASSGTERAASRGAELAALVVNQVQSLPIPLAGTAGLPGLDGAKIKIVQADTGNDPDKAVSEATRLVAQEHVAGLVSADPADATAVASERTERIGVPFLSALASADFLTERGLDWFFRVTPTDKRIAEAGLAVIEQNQGGTTKVAIVHANDPISNDSATSVEGLAGEVGDAVLHDAVFTSGQDARGARSLDAQPIRTALLGLNVPGRDTIMPWSGIRFDQTGQNVQAAALVERITPDGAQVVFPPELAGDNN